jgi:CBS domain-containing protein
MLVSVIADGIAIVLMPRASIMTEKLARRGLHIHQEYETDVLQQMRVAETMDTDPALVSADMRIGELADRIARRDPAVSSHQGILVMDAAGKLCGLMTRGDLLRALDRDPSGETIVLDAASKNLVVTYRDELLHDASAKMLRADVGRLPVVDRADPGKVVGYLGRKGILSARLRRLEDEHIREPGWIGRGRTS